MAGLVLLSMLLAQGLLDQPAAPSRIDASIAFGGHVSSDSLTELRVTAVSASAGLLSLETVGANPDAQFSLQLRPGQPARISMPLGIDFSRPPIELRAKLDTPDSQIIPLSYVRHSRPFSALVGTTASELLSQVSDTETVSRKSMPEFAAAYGQIVALAIDGRALADLDKLQLIALLEHVGSCGRLLLIDAAVSIEQIFASRAACDGRFLRVLDSAEDVEAVFRELIQMRRPTLPTERQLGRLLDDTFSGTVDLTAISLFWIAYLVVFIVLMSQARTRVAALGFSIVSAFLVLLIWPGNTRNAYVAWAETSSDGRVARYAAIGRHAATRQGTFTLPVSFGAYPEKFAGDTTSLRWRLDDERPHLAWHASPLQQIDQFTHGSFAVDPVLRAGVTGDRSVVCNTGLITSRPAFLHWHGAITAVPSLQPGATWSSDGPSAEFSSATDAPELQLFLKRSLAAPLALLQLLPVADGDDNARAWLLRFESEVPGASPCPE